MTRMTVKLRIPAVMSRHRKRDEEQFRPRGAEDQQTCREGEKLGEDQGADDRSPEEGPWGNTAERGE